MDRPLRTLVVGIADTDGVDPHLEPALRLAEAHGATAHVVHAYRPPDPLLVPYPEMAIYSPEATRSLQEGLLSRLEAQVQKVAGSAEIRCHVLSVPADVAVIEVADDVDADLIMVGATRRGTLSRTLLGTTASRVLRAASAPVLVNRRPGYGALRRIVMTTDLSDLSAAVYGRGIDLALTLRIHEDPEFRSLLVVGHDLSAPPAMRQKVIDRLMENELSDFLARVAPKSPPAEARVRLGDPATEILAEAAEWGADLLVMGSHGRGGLSRLLIGSVAESVVKGALCDVLVIPAASVTRAESEANPHTST